MRFHDGMRHGTSANTSWKKSGRLRDLARIMERRRFGEWQLTAEKWNDRGQIPSIALPKTGESRKAAKWRRKLDGSIPKPWPTMIINF
jgi:hypothetical protein